jgi:radical SAM modification target selenobiotic family peptide
METRDLKQFLSGLCIASLLAGASLTVVGCPEKPGGS